MANDINLWLQGHLSTNDYAKISSVETVWMSDGTAYVRIPGNYVDSKNFLNDNCIKHADSCSKENHEKCMTCNHFERKENNEEEK